MQDMYERLWFDGESKSDAWNSASSFGQVRSSSFVDVHVPACKDALHDRGDLRIGIEVEAKGQTEPLLQRSRNGLRLRARSAQGERRNR